MRLLNNLLIQLTLDIAERKNQQDCSVKSRISLYKKYASR